MNIEHNTIKEFINTVNYDSKEVTWDILLAEILLFIDKTDFNLIDKKSSEITSNDDGSIYIRIKSIDNSCPDLIFMIFNDNVISIHVGLGEGEYLDSEVHDTWSLVYALRETLTNLFYNKLTERVYYCDDRMIGNDCSIPNTYNGITKPYNFSKRFGGCMFWNKKSSKVIEYDAWLSKEQ